MSAPARIRERLVLVLDQESLDDALVLARRLAPWFATAKVGYELYASAGPAAFAHLNDEGYRVFADLKLYDIPTTVERGARALGRHGIAFLNFHASGGVDMLRAGIAGLHDGARSAGHDVPIALAVTVLTSDPDVSAMEARLTIAAEAGCDGVVCSAHEAERAHEHGLRAMVPGVRLPGGHAHDQARVASPHDAIAAGADWIILGRAVTSADDPEAAAAAVTEQAASALA
jgi:orotidine-5'-phosphate decarboxylase